MNKINTYKITRFFLFPLIIIADYLQTNCTKNFTPMNMGPVADPIWRKTILKHLSKKNFVIDYGCGVGFFCRLFDSKKYIGLEVNKNFIERAKKINKNYNFFQLNDKKITINKKKVDAIFINGLKEWGLYDKVWQAGAMLLPVNSVGVMGDERTYEKCVALRAVESTDGMTADWVNLPYEFLQKTSNDIINKVKGVNRVVYDISSKPPATIEWE